MLGNLYIDDLILFVFNYLVFFLTYDIILKANN